MEGTFGKTPAKSYYSSKREWTTISYLEKKLHTSQPSCSAKNLLASNKICTAKGFQTRAAWPLALGCSGSCIDSTDTQWSKPGFPGFGGLGRGIQSPLSRSRALVGGSRVNEKRKNHHPLFAGPAQADCIRAPLCFLACSPCSRQPR